MNRHLSAVIACCLIIRASSQGVNDKPEVPWVEWKLMCLYVSARIEAIVDGVLLIVPDYANNGSVDYDSSRCNSSIFGNGTFNEQILTIKWEMNETVGLTEQSTGPPEALEEDLSPFPRKWELSFFFSNDSKYNQQRNSSFYSCYKITLHGELEGGPNIDCTTENDTIPKYTFLGNLAPNKATVCKAKREAKLGQRCLVSIRSSIYKAFIPDWTSYNDTSIEICQEDEIETDWIAIIVGACLTGFVLIVTIGYLIKISRTPVVQPEMDEPKPSFSSEFTQNPELEKDFVQDKF